MKIVPLQLNSGSSLIRRIHARSRAPSPAPTNAPVTTVARKPAGTSVWTPGAMVGVIGKVLMPLLSRRGPQTVRRGSCSATRRSSPWRWRRWWGHGSAAGQGCWRAPSSPPPASCSAAPRSWCSRSRSSAAGLGERALAGLDPVETGDLDGWVVLVDDPERLDGGGVRVVVTVDGRRLEATAYGAAGAARAPAGGRARPAHRLELAARPRTGVARRPARRGPPRRRRGARLGGRVHREPGGERAAAHPGGRRRAPPGPHALAAPRRGAGRRPRPAGRGRRRLPGRGDDPPPGCLGPEPGVRAGAPRAGPQPLAVVGAAAGDAWARWGSSACWSASSRPSCGPRR